MRLADPQHSGITSKRLGVPSCIVYIYSYMPVLHDGSLQSIIKEMQHDLTFKVTDDLEGKVVGQN